MVIETVLHVLRGGGHALEEVLKEQHIKSLREDGSRNPGTGIGREIGMDEENTEEPVGPLCSYK
jgi:hypothetical protein